MIPHATSAPLSARSEPVAHGKLAVSLDEPGVDAIFRELDQCHLPGVAVGIALNGKPAYRKGFGLASMDLPVVLSPSIRMRVGSVTKQFTAFAYLLLCETGQAAIDDPIKKYLPQFHPVTHGVTMRQLMGHTSGLRDATDIKFRFGGFEGRPITCDEILALYRDLDDVDTAPETSWMYNNGCYMILSAVIELIAGQPLEQVMKQLIFAPIGMHDTLLRRWDTDFVPNSATPHALTPTGRYEKRYWGLDFTGAGGMVSTVDDLLRWLAHMDAPSVGTAATWAAMRMPHTLSNGSSTGYGLGLIRGEYRGVEVIHHGGGWIGGNAQVLKVPAAGLDIVIVANRTDAFAPVFANRILDLCLPGLDLSAKASDSPANTEAFAVFNVTRTSERESAGPDIAVGNDTFSAGVFRSRTTGRVVQLFAKDGCQIVSIDGHDLPYMLGDHGVLGPIPIWSFIKRIVTLLGDPANPSSLTLSDFGNRDELMRVNTPHQANIEAVTGRYRSETTGTDILIDRKDNSAWMHTRGRFGSMDYELSCLAEGVWRANSAISIFLDGVLSFDSNTAAFHLSSYNTRSLPFRRVT